MLLLRMYFFCCTVILLNATVNAQGLLEGARDLAVDYFADLVAAPADLPDQYAVLVRSEKAILKSSRGPSVSDTIYLFAERRGNEPASYSASTTSAVEEDRPLFRSWQQRLILNDIKVSRTGSPLLPYARQISEDVDLPKEESKIGAQAPHPYPFFFPFALGYMADSGRVDSSFGDLALVRFELKDATILESREIQSRWMYETREVIITFDPKQGGRPSEVVYMGADIKNIEGNTKKINAIHKIEWEKATWKNGESCWIPVRFRRAVMDPVNRRESELLCVMEWRECAEISPIPNVGDKDWREPFRRCFEENWDSSFSDWQQSQLERENSR